MIHALKSEWIKLHTARSNVVLLILALTVPLAITVLLTATIPIDDLGEENLFDLVLVGAGIGYILLGVLGVLLIGQEYRHTTIRVTFTADPHRVRVMTAKAVVIVATGLVIGGVVTVFSYAIGNAVLTSRGLDIALDGGTQTRALVGSTLLFALYGLIGLGVGAIIRAPAGAITFLVVWPIVVENIISAFFPEVGRWLPFTAGIQLISTSDTVDPTEAMSPRAGGLWFAVVGLAVVAIGSLRVARSDA